MLKRSVLVVAILWGVLTASGVRGAGQFDSPLPADLQILHTLNRLTFGPAPGDIEAVRRMGLREWIDSQLHPENIAENPVLEERLQPLQTLTINPAQYLRDNPVVRIRSIRPVLRVPIVSLLMPDEIRVLATGPSAERDKLLASLDPMKRPLVLASVPQYFADSPALQMEAQAAAAQVQRDALHSEIFRTNPTLRTVFTDEDLRVALAGDAGKLNALLAALAPAQRSEVALSLPPDLLQKNPEIRRLNLQSRMPQAVITADLKEGKVLRAIYSNRQLEEVLVDFWFNHFNVDEAKPQVRELAASYERDAIRPHVLGNFKDLLLATARHPAMLIYLDNWNSMAPDAYRANSNMAVQLHNSRGLNENYGRELLELHTLGVNGGYTQDDVIAAALTFTGWTIDKDPISGYTTFRFADFAHAINPKSIIGHTLKAGGEQDGLELISILARHPSTARHISKKLAQRFVADNPPETLVNRLAETFTETDGNIRAVLETLFSSPEFFSEGAWQAKVKSPLELTVSAVRALGSDTTDAFALTQRIAAMGQSLYNKTEPTGYPNTGSGWLNTDALLNRMNFGISLAAGEIAGIAPNPGMFAGKPLDAVARDVLGRDLSSATLDVLAKGLEGKESAPAFIAGLIVGSPDFQRR